VIRGLIHSESETGISVVNSWDDGRSQITHLDSIEFAGEKVAQLTSPIVPYSNKAAEFLLNNVGVGLRKTPDNFISIIHPIHLEHMDVETCVRVVASVTEVADEIEKSVTNGGDATIPNPGEQNAIETEEQSNVISAGQWLVGDEIQPGLYRFAGYVARLDAQMGIIGNESVRSGLGLVMVGSHDTYFEVSGEAISVENFPIYDVLGNAPRDGIYIAGTDLPYGKYRIHGEGGNAYYATYDRNMQRLNNDLNRGSLILDLPQSVFAVEFSGRLEQIG
jgi:hypothetical protein